MIDLRLVTVRPTRGAREHRLWDRLVEEHYYLRFHGIVGKGLRHVALHGGTRLALVGWQPGAFKLAARDRWIGWSPEQQFRRLHLICNNSRFVILLPERGPNLASRVLGLTRGFARESGGIARWRHHGQPREIFVFALTDDAAGALSRDAMPEDWNAQQHKKAEPMAEPRLRSLFECLGEVPECRKSRGKRYPLRTILAIAIAALLSQEQLEAVETFFSPSKRRFTAPAVTTFHNNLAALPPETLDDAIGLWISQKAGADTPLAMDGKDLRGTSKQTQEGRRMMVAAVEHTTGMVLRQVEVDAKCNEIPAVRELSNTIDVSGRVVTMDAMHARHETARCLLEHRADYVVTAIKENQETILEDLKAIDFGHAHRARDRQGRRAQHRADLVSHLARSRTCRTRRAAGAGAQPLGYRESHPLRARLHLQRGPLQGPCAPSAAQPLLPDERRHRALRHTLQLHVRGQSALRRPRPEGHRRDPDSARRMIRRS